eukprot:s1290_g17.t1
MGMSQNWAPQNYGVKTSPFSQWIGGSIHIHSLRQTQIEVDKRGYQQTLRSESWLARMQDFSPELSFQDAGRSAEAIMRLLKRLV